LARFGGPFFLAHRVNQTQPFHAMRQASVEFALQLRGPRSTSTYRSGAHGQCIYVSRRGSVPTIAWGHLSLGASMKLTLPRSVLLPNARSLGALWLPRPGTIRGACVEGCTHERCGSLYRLAAFRCYLCHRPLGWENPIYQVQSSGQEGSLRLMHALCSLTRRYVS